MITLRDLVWIYVIVAIMLLVPVGLTGLVCYLFGFDDYMLLLPFVFLWWGVLYVLRKKVDFSKHVNRIAYGKGVEK